MSQFETRNLAHRWVFGTLTSCSVCHCLDMVAVCAEYHEAGCKCTNPPCPPTEQERAEMEAVISKVINKQSDTIAKGGSVTVPVLGLVGTNPCGESFTGDSFVGQGFTGKFSLPSVAGISSATTPYFGFPIWELSGDITMLEQTVDLPSMQHVFKCNCKQHGNYTVKVSMDATSLSMAFDDVRTYIARILADSCQECASKRRSAIIRVADRAIGGSK